MNGGLPVSLARLVSTRNLCERSFRMMKVPLLMLMLRHNWLFHLPIFESSDFLDGDKFRQICKSDIISGGIALLFLVDTLPSKDDALNGGAESTCEWWRDFACRDTYWGPIEDLLRTSGSYRDHLRTFLRTTPGAIDDHLRTYWGPIEDFLSTPGAIDDHLRTYWGPIEDFLSTPGAIDDHLRTYWGPIEDFLSTPGAIDDHLRTYWGPIEDFMSTRGLIEDLLKTFLRTYWGPFEDLLRTICRTVCGPIDEHFEVLLTGLLRYYWGPLEVLLEEFVVPEDLLRTRGHIENLLRTFEGFDDFEDLLGTLWLLSHEKYTTIKGDNAIL